MRVQVGSVSTWKGWTVWSLGLERTLREGTVRVVRRWEIPWVTWAVTWGERGRRRQRRGGCEAKDELQMPVSCTQVGPRRSR